MFDWQAVTRFLKEHPRFNNAQLLGVKIEAKRNANWLASVYHLSPDENRGGHFLYLEVLCKQGDRERWRAINWGWEGMSSVERNLTGAIFVDKPDIEIKTHPIYSGQRIWLEVAGGDRVVNLHTMIDPAEPTTDGKTGNSRFNHSYLILFQEKTDTPPPPPPGPEPGVRRGTVTVTVSKEWLTGLPADQAGDVTFTVEI